MTWRSCGWAPGRKTPQRVLGAEGIAFDSQPGAAATVLGYPARPPFDGASLRRCTTPATTANPRLRTIELLCRQNEGSSGGPWLADFDAATGQGFVMAVTSYGGPGAVDILGGERLGSMARRLYIEADTNGPHR